MTALTLQKFDHINSRQEVLSIAKDFHNQAIKERNLAKSYQRIVDKAFAFSVGIFIIGAVAAFAWPITGISAILTSATAITVLASIEILTIGIVFYNRRIFEQCIKKAKNFDSQYKLANDRAAKLLPSKVAPVLLSPPIIFQPISLPQTAPVVPQISHPSTNDTSSNWKSNLLYLGHEMTDFAKISAMSSWASINILQLSGFSNHSVVNSIFTGTMLSLFAKIYQYRNDSNLKILSKVYVLGCPTSFLAATITTIGHDILYSIINSYSYSFAFKTLEFFLFYKAFSCYSNNQ